MGLLSKNEKIILARAGFIPMEIRYFDNAGGINFNGASFQTMIRSRRKWRDAMSHVGWTKQEINKKILRFNRLKTTRSPFDFLRIEYRPPVRMTDKQLVTQLEARHNITREFGAAYGRIGRFDTFAYGGFKGIKRPPVVR